ncbi:hypothetical protein IW262DRAFT_1451292 [Armillaria fumosa]|nr:hypothetical protein IW262DRAFT_1451292 [Armillaria fumosa]
MQTLPIASITAQLAISIYICVIVHSWLLPPLLSPAAAATLPASMTSGQVFLKYFTKLGGQYCKITLSDTGDTFLVQDVDITFALQFNKRVHSDKFNLKPNAMLFSNSLVSAAYNWQVLGPTFT